MAETFLGPLIDKLVELLADEVNLLKGVHREAKSLKDELEILQPFLKDAQAKLEQGELGDASKVWLKQLQEEADRIEDVVDEYIHYLGIKPHHPEHRCVQFVFKTCHVAESMKPRYDLASEIRDIKKSLCEIKERGQSYGLKPFEQGSTSKKMTNGDIVIGPRLGSLYIEDDDLVGIESTSKELIKSLVEGPSTRMVISLVGEGGIGKTTLAKKVYDNDVVKGHFHCYAWITVSKSYNIKMLLQIVKSQIFPQKERPMREIDTIEELIDLLRNYLQTKRYVVVFDDVWQIDFWEVIKHAFPNKSKGDRIIITTRNSSIAYSIRETPFDLVQELKPWCCDLAWELFCKKAFAFEFERRCPQELDHLSREIVKKCQGLPLVIVAIAGLLSTKEKLELEWRRVLDNLNYEFESNPQLTSVSKILSLSYHDLPYHLKSCFLYFGTFPEHKPIFEHRLCRLWIAEGFIKSSKDKTLEKVAEECLNELIHRNLVSISYTKLGFLRRCQVHDLMREIIISNADELCFYQILDRSKPRFKGKSHRLVIYNTTKDVLKFVGDSRIRTIILFHIDELSKSFVVRLFKKFKLLKVLDFQDVIPIDNLPKEVGNLIHLKYLSLNGTRVKKIPKSIGNLHNLQTLNLFDTLVEELPREISKLRKLQHLLAQQFGYETMNSYGCVRIHEGIGCLEELQTLSFVEYVGGVGFVKELEKLTKLETLGIGIKTTEMGKALGVAIEKMIHLDELLINSINIEEILDLKCISSPPPFTRHLLLRCRIQEFPGWISNLQNLRGLHLLLARLTDEPLKYLKGLPNLAFIHLYEAYDGEELHFEESGFQKLKELRLRKCEGLKVMKIDRGALPLLEKFDLEACPLVQEMPSNIEQLTNLKSLQITDMPREFVAGLQPNGGSDYWKIKHVPSVTFQFKRGGWTSYDVYKLGEANLLQRLQ